VAHLNAIAVKGESRPWPPRAWAGLILVSLCWPLNWALPGVRTAYLFFPLWLGYILVVDVLVESRRGSSIWTRSNKEFVLLFILSAPAWWLFELINRRTQNWEYRGAEVFSDLEYNLLCTISFSIVIPAVLETAELVRSFQWIDHLARGAKIQPTTRLCLGLLLIGLAMLILMLLWPRIFYPFAWTSLVLILEPLNRWLGRRNFLDKLQSGDWRPVIALPLGTLICGFFWEMWNYYSFPKWVYHTPGAEFMHIFEMPLLGYIGYIPFGLEIYLLTNFLWPRGVGCQ
jgi:hypothetical protein